MTARFFADTNVAVYALDADPQRHARAFSIMLQSPVISTQIVNEILNVLTSKKGVPRARANRYARIMLRRCEVVPLTTQVVERAISIGERYQISHWDALVGCCRVIERLRYALFRGLARRGGIRKTPDRHESFCWVHLADHPSRLNAPVSITTSASAQASELWLMKNVRWSPPSSSAARSTPSP
ncbi:PIN domain-containing protein [Lamprobacter modestohalophilus]|uniref:PIN domain-containing protein n=1 Tax=Lamprobacter modestohalophilus TaxID=1064514 RepID=UPI002ADEB12E|nr:PIN domain-containing protein [Lamprobacter modestohalophilus]MEA1050410.1 PIN domain-containing protein [Lamprobacter modestohalophilus]